MKCKKTYFSYKLILFLLIFTMSLGVGCSNKKSDKKQPQATEKETKDISYLQDYYNLIVKYQDKYGKTKLDQESNYLLRGLCYAKLIDFNNDGTEELVLAYGKDDTWGIKYSYEVWAYKSGAILKIASGTPFGEDGNCCSIIISSFKGQKYLITGQGDAGVNYTLFGYDGEKWKEDIHFYAGPDENGERMSYLIDDSNTSEEEYAQLFASRTLNNEKVSMYVNSESGNGAKTCKKIVKYTKEMCLNYEKESGKKEEKKQKMEVSDYFEKYQNIIVKLNMEQSESAEFSENITSYAFGSFFLKNNESSYSLRNEENNGITLYGISPGERYENVDEIMEDNDWKTFYTYNEIHEFIRIYDNKEYFVEILTDTEGKVVYWELFNESPSYILSDAYETLRRDTLEDWKKEYLEYLREQSVANDSEALEVNFAFIDGDDIPEMIINYESAAEGAKLCYMVGNKIDTEEISLYGISYIEKENLILDSGGNMDNYYDNILSLKNGHVRAIIQGTYGAHDNSQLEFDEEGMPIYEYYWNSKMVSAEEYENNLEQIFDKSIAQRVDEGMMDVETAKEKIINM